MQKSKYWRTKFWQFWLLNFSLKFEFWPFKKWQNCKFHIFRKGKIRNGAIWTKKHVLDWNVLWTLWVFLVLNKRTLGFIWLQVGNFQFWPLPIWILLTKVWNKSKFENTCNFSSFPIRLFKSKSPSNGIMKIWPAGALPSTGKEEKMSAVGRYLFHEQRPPAANRWSWGSGGSFKTLWCHYYILAALFFPLHSVEITEIYFHIFWQKFRESAVHS